MPSPPLDNTLSKTTSGVACHHRSWAAHTIERRRVWHDITSLGLHAWSEDVGRGMTSPPLDNTHGRPTSGMACHHRLWAAHIVKRRQAWHDITAFGKHTRSNDVGHGMPSSPLGSTYGRTTSGKACHHRVLAAHTVQRHRAWHAIIAFGQHKRSNDAGRGMKSPPLDCTHDQTTSGVA